MLPWIIYFGTLYASYLFGKWRGERVGFIAGVTFAADGILHAAREKFFTPSP